MISSPDTAAETVQTAETDTLLAKTRTVLQSARPGTDTDETITRNIE